VIVVDTNIICYRWIASPYSSVAEKAWKKDPDWIAPFLWRSEFRNVVANALRHKLIAADAAAEIIERAEGEFAGREFLVSSRAVMRLVTKSRCSAYDCEFAALAEEQDVWLLTADRQILRDFPKLAISLDKFVGH
jgi:predicted nucleic acid-binding protein